MVSDVYQLCSLLVGYHFKKEINTAIISVFKAEYTYHTPANPKLCRALEHLSVILFALADESENQRKNEDEKLLVSLYCRLHFYSKVL